MTGQSTGARPVRIAVVSGGLSSPSSTRLLADRLTAAVVERLPGANSDDAGATDVEVIELRELAHPLADHLLSGFPSGKLAAAIDTIGAADALIVVTPVFAASYSGLFKTFFDVIDPDAMRGTPVLMGATAGTARHSLVLEHAVRPLLSYLGAATVPTAVFAASEDWGHPGLDERINRAATDLVALLGRSGASDATGSTARAGSAVVASTRPDPPAWESSEPLTAPMEFAEMLRRASS